MLIEPYSRFFLRHELRFRAARDRGEPLRFRAANGILDVEDICKTAIKAGKASHALKSKDVVQLTQVDVREKEKIAVLLFRRSDPDAVTPVFEHLKTRKLRKADKRDDEALAVSAHLIMCLEETGAAYPTYHAVLEEVPGLSQSYIKTLLGNILRASPYEFKNRRGETDDTYSVVDFHGLASENVGSALKSATIPRVTLVRAAQIKGSDTSDMIIPRDEQMNLLVKANVTDKMKIIAWAQKYAREHNWEQVKVVMDMPEERTRVLSIDRQVDAATMLFMRSVQVDVANRLDGCTEKINEELVNKAIEIFKEDGVLQ